MSKKKVITIISVIAVILLLVGIVVLFFWAKNNTSFFTSKISEKDLNANNLNDNSENFKLLPYKINGKILNIPKGFTISEYARGVGSARFFSFNEQDTMFIGTNNNDKIYAIQDTNDDGFAETVNEIASNLSTPHSTYYYNGDLYVGEENRVSVYRNINNDGSYGSFEVLVNNLPSGNTLTGGGHKTRTVVIGPDAKMYVSVGSSCNVCIEDDSRRATIMRYNLDGSGEEIFATGLRNTVGFDFNANGALYGVDMGRDQIGDDTPPEEVNIIEQGKDYGWPYCYGNNINNPEFNDRKQYCKEKTETPFLNMQAHSAPLGMEFIKQSATEIWPQQYSKGFFVGFHGSWNRTVPTGYKVVFVDTSGPQPKQYNFLTGWLENNAESWGRPVDVGFDSKGNFYVSDDKQGIIYKVSYSK